MLSFSELMSQLINHFAKLATNYIKVPQDRIISKNQVTALTPDLGPQVKATHPKH